MFWNPRETLYGKYDILGEARTSEHFSSMMTPMDRYPVLHKGQELITLVKYFAFLAIISGVEFCSALNYVKSI